MDVRDLQFADGTFDVAVDKGNRPFWSHVGSKFWLHKGMMDAMMTAEGSVWASSLQSVSNQESRIHMDKSSVIVIRKWMRLFRRSSLPFVHFWSKARVLKNGGVFIYLTFGQPHSRRRYLTRPGTTLEIKTLGEAFHYCLYILRKVNTWLNSQSYVEFTGLYRPLRSSRFPCKGLLK